MKHQVAVKVLSNRHSEDPTSVKRFFREGQVAAALVHPNIVRAHDLNTEEGLHYLVMEYVFGSTLQDLVAKHGPLGVERAANYVQQAALGLHHAHLNGMVHRDVKPANLMLERSGDIKVLDLGMALFNQGDEEKLTNHLIGTADYLAPEQARDSHRVDVRADIYSLGATLYFLLAGAPPLATPSRWAKS
jgi:serine/threonine protein kinase